MYDASVPAAAVRAVEVALAVVVLWPVAALAAGPCRRALARFVACGSRVEVRLPSPRPALRRVGLAVLAALAARSELVYRWCVARRAEAEVFSGKTQYEEWCAEAEALPAAARLALAPQLARYVPSRALLGRARSLRGVNCRAYRQYKYRRSAV